jgi:8-oxo-dGTP pyrophosphatase MutT (NUDIX family)
MHRQPLLSLLRQHLSNSANRLDSNEEAMTKATITFVEQHADCFERSLLEGHVTGSAWIVSPDRQRVVLIHHRKLDRWFQPGGHADGDPDVAAVAFREAQEETGLTSIRLVAPTIFDVDIHPIPARGNVTEHLHYDIRFLFEADDNESFGEIEEVNDIRWFTLPNANFLASSESISRMVRKIYQKL